MQPRTPDPTEQVFAITATELDRLHGSGPLASTIYLHLRAWMDYATGTVGKSRPVSLAMLSSYTETHTPRGNGVQIEQPSQKAIRTSIERLQRAGLLRRLAGDSLHFLMPLALNVQSRTFQTRHNDGTKQSTEPDTVESSTGAGFRRIPDTENGTPGKANPAHIMYQVNLKTPLRAVDNFSGRGTRPGKERLAEGSDGHSRLLRYGQRRGIEPRPGESWQEYRSRLA